VKFAAIDIGSNAARLLIANVIPSPKGVSFKKESLLRVPLRLGEESFAKGVISEAKATDFLDTMRAFHYLLRVQRPMAWMACGTAALRDAKNGAALVEKVFQETGLQIEIIDGQREAEIICSSPLDEKIEAGSSQLYVDVGGGSTELTLLYERQRIASASFQWGTLRALQGRAVEGEAERVQAWIERYIPAYRPLVGIGTGGNINTLHKLANLKSSKPMTVAKMEEMLAFLKTYSVEERIEILGLRPDRADVIVHATEIYLRVMRLAQIEAMYVPQIGLVDGIIHLLYERHLEQARSRG
jgi:exopolyphosphatase/guanosine-5'-triphosphate,3'-diphosphate pyrophosphatase